MAGRVEGKVARVTGSGLGTAMAVMTDRRGRFSGVQLEQGSRAAADSDESKMMTGSEFVVVGGTTAT
ncbi:hypothetical protein F0U62_27540 [Cystobacter fuscus]|uniref:hypothetical protein n=1 Tax=Cystobacter fuscus TaxID=43 RepID=UPI002B30A159|nr:hypothetical protein F0U62_27540 [Cystobacter fuscus]